MLIENVVSLTFGILENTPSVRDYHNIVVQSTHVKRGDLFVVTDAQSSHYEEAIANGAYALLYDQDIDISDREIAWIRVENVHEAVEKILRHQLLQYQMEVFSCEPLELDFFELLHAERDPLLILRSTTIEAMAQIIHACGENSLLLIDDALSKSTALFPTCKSLDMSITSPLTPFETSLFESSFLFDGRYYENVRISPLLLPYLERILNVLKSRNHAYTLARLASLKHFEPLFLSRALQRREFGSSECVIIFESDPALFLQAQDFLKKHASWATIVIMTPENFSVRAHDTMTYETYRHTDDIMPKLREICFNFLLLLHESTLKESFETPKHTRQLTFTL